MFSYIRDDDGVLTKFKDGDRYVYCYPSDAGIPQKQSICRHQCMLFHRKRTRSTFKSCKVGELQHSSKENEEGTSLPDETLDLVQLPHPYIVQGDTDHKSQYKHQVEQQGLARKEDLPDEASSLDALPHDNEGSKEDPNLKGNYCTHRGDRQGKYPKHKSK